MQKEPQAVCLSVTLTFPSTPFTAHAWAAQTQGVTILYDAVAGFHGKIDVGENGNTHMT